MTDGKWLEASEHLAHPLNPHAPSQLAGKSFCVRSTDADGLERATLERLVLAAGGALAPKRAATHLLVARRDVGEEAGHAEQEAVDQQWLFRELIEGGDPADDADEDGDGDADAHEDGDDQESEHDSEEF